MHIPFKQINRYTYANATCTRDSHRMDPQTSHGTDCGSVLPGDCIDTDIPSPGISEIGASASTSALWLESNDDVETDREHKKPSAQCNSQCNRAVKRPLEEEGEDGLEWEEEEDLTQMTQKERQIWLQEQSTANNQRYRRTKEYGLETFTYMNMDPPSGDKKTDTCDGNVSRGYDIAPVPRVRSIPELLYVNGDFQCACSEYVRLEPNQALRSISAVLGASMAQIACLSTAALPDCLIPQDYVMPRCCKLARHALEEICPAAAPPSSEAQLQINIAGIMSWANTCYQDCAREFTYDELEQTVRMWRDFRHPNRDLTEKDETGSRFRRENEENVNQGERILGELGDVMLSHFITIQDVMEGEMKREMEAEQEDKGDTIREAGDLVWENWRRGKRVDLKPKAREGSFVSPEEIKAYRKAFSILESDENTVEVGLATLFTDVCKINGKHVHRWIAGRESLGFFYLMMSKCSRKVRESQLKEHPFQNLWVDGIFTQREEGFIQGMYSSVKFMRDYMKPAMDANQLPEYLRYMSIVFPCEASLRTDHSIPDQVEAHATKLFLRQETQPDGKPLYHWKNQVKLFLVKTSKKSQLETAIEAAREIGMNAVVGKVDGVDCLVIEPKPTPILTV